MLPHAHMCPCIFSLHGGYLMETAPFPDNSASKQTHWSDLMKGRRSYGKQNLRRTTHFSLYSPVSCFIPIRGEPGRLELKKLKKHWRFCLLLFFPPQVAAWINEKNSIAQDDSWKDPSNLQTKLQRHQAFQAEIMANRNRLDSIKSVREVGFWARVGNWHERLCRQCELQWSQPREGESLSSHWCCPCYLLVHWEASSFSPSKIFCVHLFLHSLSLLLSSVTLLCIFTVHAMETDGGLQ